MLDRIRVWIVRGTAVITVAGVIAFVVLMVLGWMTGTHAWFALALIVLSFIAGVNYYVYVLHAASRRP